MMILASAILLVSCGKDKEKQNSLNENQSSIDSQKQIPVYQGMTITSIQSTSELLYGNNKGENGKDDFDYDKDNGNHNGHFKGDHTDKDEEIDEEKPYPDNNENENIEEEIKSSLNVIGSPYDIYYATPNEYIYINIHIDNPDKFEILSFTLNGEKYSSYMFESGSTLEKLVLKYNVGNVGGIVKYTIDAIKYVDGTEIKDVTIGGDKTVKVGVKNDDQVTADISNLTVTTSTIDFDVNVTDKYDLVENSNDNFKAVLYDGENIVATQNIKDGENHVSFSGLSTNTLYQYAIVACYDDLSGNGFGSYIISKNAVYTEAVVLFDNISFDDNSVLFTLAWNDKYEATLTAIKLVHNDEVINNLSLDTTSIDLPLAHKTYIIVAEYIYNGNTESIQLEVACKYAVPDFEIIDLTYTNTSVNFNITETDESNIGSVTKIELYRNGELYKTADNNDVREFLNLAPSSDYVLKVTYEYDLEEGDGVVTIEKSASFTVSHDHVWIDADCFTPKTCTTCGITSGKPLGHTEVTDKAVSPTCTKTGLTEGKHCSVCNVVLVYQQIIPTNDHTAVTDSAVAPTCTSTGLTEGKHCSVCDVVLVYQQIILANGHTVVIDKAVTSTCTSTGLTEGKHCSVCNEVLLAQKVIPVVAHTYDDKYDESCNVCGFIREAECAHLNTEIIKGFDSTCTLAGLTDGTKCLKCKEILVEQTEISAKGHTVTIDKAVAPTCTKTGLTIGKHCSVCNEVFAAQTVVDALGHTEVTDSAVDPTCTSTGLTKGKHCSVCNVVLDYQQIIPANGHTVVTDKSVASTCTSTGLTEGKHCSVCNKVLVAQTVVKALGHNYTSTVTAPTATEDGLATYCCSACSYSYTETITPNNLALTSSNRSKIGYTGESRENLVIPAVFQDNGIWYRVTSIGYDAFGWCENLISVTIPDSVTSIGDSAFYRCESLTSITIPDSVTSIGKNAFGHCYDLTNVVIGNSVTSIGDGAFAFSLLTSITIPDSVTSIGDEVFCGCSRLTNVVIGNSVTSIGDEAFYLCYNLTSITIPDSVISIGFSAFESCSKLTSVTFENTEGWWYAFYPYETSGTSISATDLADPATAAKYLRSTYYDYYWHRT